MAILFVVGSAGSDDHLRPELTSDFADLHQTAPDIVIEIRYAGSHNFVGHPVPGYSGARCLLTRPAAEALAHVQKDLEQFGLGLKVYDCYRPQRSVDFFVRWASDQADQSMKKEFYPHTDKAKLIPDGYIASPSGHSRGSTVDLTIVPAHYSSPAGYSHMNQIPCTDPAPPRNLDGALDMGTAFDCFDVRANVGDKNVAAQQRANRMLLATIMTQHGFNSYHREWWHFTLKNEPHPDTYFDQPVK